MFHVCTGLEDKRVACKLASSHLQDRSQQVQELATISEPRARYMITPICATKCCVHLELTNEAEHMALFSDKSLLQA